MDLIKINWDRDWQKVSLVKKKMLLLHDKCKVRAVLLCKYIHLITAFVWCLPYSFAFSSSYLIESSRQKDKLEKGDSAIYYIVK